MKPITTTIAVCLLLVLGACYECAAQDKAEITFGYSYLNQNTKISVQSADQFFHSFLGGMNGGDAAVVFNVKNNFGLKADFSGYTASGNFTTSGKTFEVAFGPQIKKHSGTANPFGEILIGVAHKSVSGFSLSGGQDAFTAIAGGGLDVKVSPKVSIRAAEVDYIWTAWHTVYPTHLAVISSRQNNFRVVSGINFSF